MFFRQMVKGITIISFEILSAVLSLVFIFTKMVSFTRSAANFGYINVRFFAYIFFVLALFALPVVLLTNHRNFHKGSALRLIFYLLSVSLFVGTVSDLIVFKGFSGYTFREGDFTFINVFWNMAHLGGAIFSLLISALYFLLGIWIKRRRKIAYILYLAIFILSAVTPFVNTLLIPGAILRIAFLEKAVFILAAQLLVLVSMSICVSSRDTWVRYIWN